MNIDERAVAGIEALRADVDRIDTASALVRLKRTRARRARVRVAVATAAALAVVAVWQAEGRSGSAENGPVSPAEVRANGVIVTDGGRVTAHGALPVAVVGRVDGDLSWSPDGSELAFEADTAVQIADVATGATRALTACRRCGFAWSPDGAAMAVAAGPALRLVDVETGASNVVPTPGLSDVRQPAWSPDGARLAFVADDADRRAGLYAVSADGSDLARLWAPDAHPTPIGPWDPAWSAAGDQIAFVDSAASDADPEAMDLTIRAVNVDGTGSTQLAAIGSCLCLGFVPGLTWSPDGSYLAVNTLAPDGVGGLYLLDADGSDLRLLADGAEGPIAWQPRDP
jgi:Tol biopolymer transport system component